MKLDPATLSLLLCLQLLVLAACLSLVADWRGRPWLRWIIGGLWLQLLAWLLIAALRGQPWGSALSYVSGALTFSMSLHALRGWQGAVRGQRLLWLLPLLIAAAQAYALLFDPAADWARRGLSNLLMAALIALLVQRLVADRLPGHRPWTRLLALTLAGLSLLTTWRGLTALLLPAAYPAMASSHPLSLTLLLTGNAATLVTGLAFMAAWRGEVEEKLRSAALTDALTGLLNRRGLEERAASLMADSRRHGDTLLALLIDIDHFKQINDRHGHAQGDAALQLLAQLLLQQLRLGDCGARLGGEEFVLLMARTQAAGAEALDRRLRATLAEQAPRQLGFALDYSAGCSLLQAGDRHVHDLLARADAALYRAKAAGRGRLCQEESAPPRPDLHESPP